MLKKGECKNVAFPTGAWALGEREARERAQRKKLRALFIIARSCASRSPNA